MENPKVNNLEEQKQKILQFIKVRGPNITMRVSNYLKLDSLITSAILADLLSDKAIKMSFMKVGNSPLYYIPGQEHQLETFSHYLGGKEREAFEILKREKVLKDEKQLPAIRVALRAIKDFAFSFEYNGNLYWRYLTTNENEAYELINSGRANFSQLPQIYRPLQSLQLSPQVHQQTQPKAESVQYEINEVKPMGNSTIENKIVDNSAGIETLKEVKAKKPRSKIIRKNLFIENVENFLAKEGIELINVIKKGKKEYHALVSINSLDNKNEYLCIAKEKKSISDKELMKNLQIGQKKNLPVLFVTSGEASKKAVEWLDYLGNVIVYKKLE